MVALVPKTCYYCQGEFSVLSGDDPLCPGCLRALAVLGLMGERSRQDATKEAREGEQYDDEEEEDEDGVETVLEARSGERGQGKFWRSQWEGRVQTPDLPTVHPPGTREKISVMRERAGRGETVFHPADARFQGDPRPVQWVLRNCRPGTVGRLAERF